MTCMSAARETYWLIVTTNAPCGAAANTLMCKEPRSSWFARYSRCSSSSCKIYPRFGVCTDNRCQTSRLLSARALSAVPRGRRSAPVSLKEGVYPGLRAAVPSNLPFLSCYRLLSKHCASLLRSRRLRLGASNGSSDTDSDMACVREYSSSATLVDWYSPRCNHHICRGSQHTMRNNT
ncbi:hypothetical protein BDZ85DRAFT_268094 [Elsinoe ampelina]|uniref:Uncharacterized protein n=1 Tax=Elsinoe ampelina TaxID=302913 RepID=A0A6A6G1Q0_9PEZI|nr:hypothetical protein BDZ85DRAFT_268094 [Elsinoe ampelina]